MTEPEDAEDEKWTFFTGVSTSTRSSNSSMRGGCGDRHLSKIYTPKEPQFANMVNKNFTKQYTQMKDSLHFELPDINLRSRSNRSTANNKRY